MVTHSSSFHQLPVSLWHWKGDIISHLGGRIRATHCPIFGQKSAYVAIALDQILTMGCLQLYAHLFLLGYRERTVLIVARNVTCGLNMI